LTRLDSGRPGRITLGLLNTYDRRVLREPHRRAIARAGAVAAAFDCNLALFAFPMPQGVGTALELAEWSSAKTTIGQDAAYFVTLAKAGRADLFPEPKGSFPPQLGTAVATTSKPRLPKTLTIARLADRVRGGESVMLVFGLGPHGLPDEARLRRGLRRDGGGLLPRDGHGDRSRHGSPLVRLEKDAGAPSALKHP